MNTTSLASSLPDEVIIEILSWLPVKSLLRFRCVAKPWLHLVSLDLNFIKLHLDRSKYTNPNPSIITLGRPPERKNTQLHYAEEYTKCNESIAFDMPFPGYELVATCNGLLCFTDLFPNIINPCFNIWNPLVGGCITISYPPILSAGLSSGVSAVFGFGCNGGVDEFNIVTVLSSEWPKSLGFKPHVIMYTIGTNSWRVMDNVWKNIIPHDDSVFVNGAIHWMALKYDDLVTVSSLAVAFDVRDEVFREITLPDGVQYRHEHRLKVGELGGLLCLYCSNKKEEIHIWVMKDYGVVSSWEKRFRVQLSSESFHAYFLKPLSIVDDGKIIIKKDIGQIILYDPRTNSIRNLSTFGFTMHNTSTFRGSLVSPTSISRGMH